jgi:hypothetical protein
MKKGRLAELTKACPTAPTRPKLVNNMCRSPCHHLPLLGCISIPSPPSVIKHQFCPPSEDSAQHTCLILHFQPFLVSCGHLSANVAFRASIILTLAGYSWLKSPSCFSIVATIAHPQSGECFRCSTSGLSSSSHPSSALWQRKQATLSGLP